LRAVRLFVYYLLFSTQIWIELRSVFFSALLFNFQGPRRFFREALDNGNIGTQVCQRFIFVCFPVCLNPRSGWLPLAFRFAYLLTGYRVYSTNTNMATTIFTFVFFSSNPGTAAVHQVFRWLSLASIWG